MDWGELLKSIIAEQGIWAALFVASLAGFHVWIYRLYENRLSDLRGERDRLATENLEYRDRFQHFTDKMLEYRQGK